MNDTLPRAIVVMGVSGAGKSTLGRALADALGYHFVEGDDLHPAANVAKMAAGVPLDDDDRRPWLADVAAALAAAAREGGGVVACSALKRRYRDLIRRDVPTPLAIVHPTPPLDLLRERLARRRGHYMPVSLLASQIDTLEPPEADERAVTVDGGHPLDRQIAAAVARLRDSDA